MNKFIKSLRQSMANTGLRWLPGHQINKSTCGHTSSCSCGRRCGTDGAGGGGVFFIDTIFFFSFKETRVNYKSLDDFFYFDLFYVLLRFEIRKLL